MHDDNGDTIIAYACTYIHAHIHIHIHTQAYSHASNIYVLCFHNFRVYINHGNFLCSPLFTVMCPGFEEWWLYKWILNFQNL